VKRIEISEEGPGFVEVGFYVLLTVLRNSKDQRNDRMVGTHRGVQVQLILFPECHYESLGSFSQYQYDAQIEIASDGTRFLRAVER
jgi:hypothetical protein